MEPFAEMAAGLSEKDEEERDELDDSENDQPKGISTGPFLKVRSKKKKRPAEEEDDDDDE